MLHTRCSRLQESYRVETAVFCNMAVEEGTAWAGMTDARGHRNKGTYCAAMAIKKDKATFSRVIIFKSLWGEDVQGKRMLSTKRAMC